MTLRTIAVEDIFANAVELLRPEPAMNLFILSMILQN